MADSIREEFETYVKTLTETISKEIFLEELKDICEQNKQLADSTLQTNETIRNFTEDNVGSVKKLQGNVEKGLKDIKLVINQINKEYAKVFQEFSKSVNSLNEEERQKFIDDFNTEFTDVTTARFQEVFSNAIEELQVLSQGNNEYYQDFRLLTEENKENSEHLVLETKELGSKVNKQLKEINKTIEDITKEYDKIFQEFSQSVNSLNEEERQKFIDAFHTEFTDVTTARFQEVFSNAIEELQVLSQINNEYYQDFRLLTEENKENSEHLVLETKELGSKVNKQLKEINKTIEDITKEYAKVFQGFSSNVIKLNEEERKKVRNLLDALLTEYRFVFSEDVKKKYQEIAENFSTDLAGIYEKYYEKITDYREMLQRAEEDIVGLDEHTIEFMEKTEKFHNDINEGIELLYQSIDEIFQKYSERVSELNEEERKKFREQIQEVMEGCTWNFTQEIDRQSDAMQVKFEQLFHNMQEEFGNILSDYKGISEKVLVSNSNHLKISLKNIQGLNLLNKSIQEAVKKSNDEIKKTFTGLIEENRTERKELMKYLQQVEKDKKKLLEENIQLKKEFQEKQEEFLNAIHKNQEKNHNNYLMNQSLGHEKLLEQLKKKQVSDERFLDSFAWKIYMSISNAIIMLMMVLFFIMLCPWWYFGTKNSIILLIVTGVLLLLILFRKQIAKIILGFLKR